MCNVYVGCGDWFVMGGSFVCDFIAEDYGVCSNFCIVMMCLVHRILVDYG